MIAQLADRGHRFSRLSDFREHAVRHGLRLHREQDGVTRVSDADVGTYFRDDRGRLLGVDRMRFDLDVRGEMPRFVTRPGDGRAYSTRFYRQGGQILHETMIDGR